MEIKENVAEILSFVKDGLSDSYNFVLEQAPLLIQEIILYGRVKETITCSLLILVMIVIGVIGSKLAKAVKKIEEEDEQRKIEAGERSEGVFFWLVPHVVAGGICIVPFVNFLRHLDTCLKAWFAPRLYLIEYVSTLIGD